MIGASIFLLVNSYYRRYADDVTCSNCPLEAIMVIICEYNKTCVLVLKKVSFSFKCCVDIDFCSFIIFIRTNLSLEFKSRSPRGVLKKW